MKLRMLSALIALALALSGLAALSEGLAPEVEAQPDELDEFELSAPEATPEPTPAPAPEQTPLPTLAPGSINYAEGKVNFEGEIWTILTRRWGLEAFQAAALMSSIYAESAFCPYNVQGKDGVDDRGNYNYRTNDGVGFGLAQWTSSGRKAALRRHAIAAGDANLVWDFDIQMAFMKGEISLGTLKGFDTMYEATEWVVLSYERPNQAYANSWPGSRYEIAKQIYAAHTGSEYEEPEAAFEIHAADGADAAGGVDLDGERTLTVSSNYYWRLTGRPAWLEVTTPAPGDESTWTPCVCGYGGETPLRLRAILPPVNPEAELRFEIFRGGHILKALKLRYTGTLLPEVLSQRLSPWMEALGNLYRAGEGLSRILYGQSGFNMLKYA